MIIDFVEALDYIFLFTRLQMSFSLWGPLLKLIHRLSHIHNKVRPLFMFPWSISVGINWVCTWKKTDSFHRLWPGALMADADRCGSVGQEALSVVSEDQPIFESAYSTAPAMHMKTEMTSPGAFSQASKQSPEPTEPEWVGPPAQNPGKRAEHVNGTRWVRSGRGHRGATGSRIIWL